jgi:hypothetical protein
MFNTFGNELHRKPTSIPQWKFLHNRHRYSMISPWKCGTRSLLPGSFINNSSQTASLQRRCWRSYLGGGFRGYYIAVITSRSLFFSCIFPGYLAGGYSHGNTPTGSQSRQWDGSVFWCANLHTAFVVGLSAILSLLQTENYWEKIH